MGKIKKYKNNSNDGKIIKSKNDLKTNDIVEIRLADGSKKAKVMEE